MIELILIVVGLVGLIIGSYCDFETREIPNWLNFSLLASGIGLRIIGSIAELSFSHILFGIIGLVAMIALGNLLYYSKQWGGGDTKLLIAMGALFGSLSFSPWFLFHFLVNLVVVGSLYGLVWSFYLSIRHFHRFMSVFPSVFKAHRTAVEIFSGVGILLVIISFLVSSKLLSVLFLVLGILSFAYIVLIIFVRTVESSCMFRKIRVKHLTEGDWIAQDVHHNKKLIYSASNPGVSRSQINLMIKFKLKRVLVKEGVPFVPSFLIAFIVTLALGNVLTFLL